MSHFYIYTPSSAISSFFFFNDTATTEIYTLSLHDALPISAHRRAGSQYSVYAPARRYRTDILDSTLRYCRYLRGDDLSRVPTTAVDRKSTRLNSSHT